MRRFLMAVFRRCWLAAAAIATLTPITTGRAQATSYTFITINDPMASGGTVVTGINDVGQIVGTYNTSTITSSFVYDNGSFTTINDPDAKNSTGAFGINDAGQIVGYYSNATGNHGFVYIGGDFTTVPQVGVFGINDNGQTVGVYFASSAGFVDTNGKFSIVTVPGSVSGSTSPHGINNAGEIVGDYEVFGGYYKFHGFLDSNGSLTAINDPLSPDNTYVYGINNLDQIVGDYQDSTGWHGFVEANGIYTTINDPSATSGTRVEGINDAGQIVGYYSDATGSHGFLAAPITTQVPEPISLALFFTGVIGIGTIRLASRNHRRLQADPRS
jgi:probable HAF family extracellular repeat protein